jgi:hypothetical protein
LVALFGALLLWTAQSAGALPWPAPTGASLAGLLMLVAVTRVTGEMGLPFQRRLRYAIAGVAIAAGSWFAGVSVLSQRPDLLLLGALHIATAWLAAYGEPDPKERRLGILVLAGAMIALSLIALSAGSLNAYTPMFTATALVGAGVLVIGFAHTPGTSEPPR